MTKKSQQIQKQERVIYLLLSPGKKKFIIGHCLKESLRETYRHNLKGRRNNSEIFIKEISPERPCLFVLETILCTSHEAENLLPVWTKIFLENGYESYNHPILIEMTEHLYFDNEFRYRERNNLELQKITMCENCQMPIYNRQTCKYYPNKTQVKDN